jgi:hypothetical protein
MLDTIGDLISGLVELVSRGVFAIARALFRWEASVERPVWIRAVAIGVILVICAGLLTLLFRLFAIVFYILIILAVIAAAVGWLGLG